MSERDRQILDQLLTDTTPKSQFRWRVRDKVYDWVFNYTNGMEFLTKQEWEYLRAIYREQYTHLRECPNRPNHKFPYNNYIEREESVMDIRTHKYTMKEFNELARTAEGDIINLFDHFILMTGKQVSLLTEDDRYYYNNMMEELEYELATLLR